MNCQRCPDKATHRIGWFLLQGENKPRTENLCPECLKKLKRNIQPMIDADEMRVYTTEITE